MTDHKFTGEEIIKTLKNAKYKVNGVVSQGVYLSVETFNAVVDLIGRQKAEIESLQAVHADMTESLRLAAEANKDMQAEIERLKKIGDYKTSEVLRHDAAIRELHKQLETARAEAIKEFAQRLKSDLGRIPQHQFTRSQVEWSINTFVKEMTEESK
jgi:hypothetical protein